MSVTKIYQVEFDLRKDSEWNGRRWGRLHCVLQEISNRIADAHAQGYEIPNDWNPPEKFVIPLTENPDYVELHHLKARLRKLRRQIKEKEKEYDLGLLG